MSLGERFLLRTKSCAIKFIRHSNRAVLLTSLQLSRRHFNPNLIDCSKPHRDAAPDQQTTRDTRFEAKSFLRTRHIVRLQCLSDYDESRGWKAIVISFSKANARNHSLEYFDLTTETARRLKGHDENGKQSVESNQIAIHDLTFTNDSAGMGRNFILCRSIGKLRFAAN